MKYNKLAHRHVCLRVLVLPRLILEPTTTRHQQHTGHERRRWRCEGGEVVWSQGNSGWPSLPHPSLVLAVFSLLPSISTRSTLSTIPSFVRSRLSFSFSFSRTHHPTFLVFPLSPRKQSLSNLSHHPLHHDQLDSPPHPCLRYPILATSSSLPRPCCLILVASTLACCLVLAALLPSLHRSHSNFSSSHPLEHTADADQPPVAGAPISSQLRALLPSFSCLHHVFFNVFLLSRYRNHVRIRQTDRMKKP